MVVPILTTLYPSLFCSVVSLLQYFITRFSVRIEFCNFNRFPTPLIRKKMPDTATAGTCKEPKLALRGELHSILNHQVHVIRLKQLAVCHWINSFVIMIPADTGPEGGPSESQEW